MNNDIIYKSAKFVKRLYKIVSDPEVQEITWSKSGKSFIVCNKEKFLKSALPLISKTKEYAAFVRLLNHYGFTKVTSINDYSEEYFHPNFIKNEEKNLMFITRVKYRQMSINDEISGYKKDTQLIRQNLEYLSNSNYRLNMEIEDLKERMSKQDKTIEGLIEVLSRVFKVGIQNQKLKALTLENNHLEGMLRENLNNDLEPQNKRRMTNDELEKCLKMNSGDINQLMLMGNYDISNDNIESSKSDRKDDKDDNFSLNDFF